MSAYPADRLPPNDFSVSYSRLRTHLLCRTLQDASKDMGET